MTLPHLPTPITQCDGSPVAGAGTIEALRAQLAEAREAVFSLLWMPGVRAALDALPDGDPIEPFVRKAKEAEQWESRAAALQSQVEMLAGALEPFGKMADEVDRWVAGSGQFAGAFDADDLRRARTALATLEKPDV